VRAVSETVALLDLLPEQYCTVLCYIVSLRNTRGILAREGTACFEAYKTVDFSSCRNLTIM